MKYIKFFTLSICLLIGCNGLQAQSFGQRLGNAVKKSAENTAVRKAEQKTEQAVGKAIDKATDPDTYENKDNEQKQQNNNAQQQQTQQAGSNADTNSGGTSVGASSDTNTPASTAPVAPEMAWNAYDFVAGDDITFDDNHANEQLGEFPSMWDLVSGEAEIAKMNGQNVICMKNGSTIRPLMKNMYNYIGDVFSIEFDYYFTLEKEGENHGQFEIKLANVDNNWAGNNAFNMRLPGYVGNWYWTRSDEESRKVDYTYNWITTSKENRNGNRKQLMQPGNWVHISLSFNKRAMKIYVNETRVANIPNMSDDIGWIQIEYFSASETQHGFIRNFRIAKGAVPLYDRMTTDGKFITYGITFDVGKSVIKPESMGEINRIVTLMTENADLKFSVEGHTDNTGNAATNQTLSEARSKAIVDKLVENGIAANRLASAGKGQDSPIAENSTDEGRAKNRRVEFVKQ